MRRHVPPKAPAHPLRQELPSTACHSQGENHTKNMFNIQPLECFPFREYANTSPTTSHEQDDLYHGNSLAELLGAAPGSPVANELTSMQEMLIATSQRLIQLETKQSENDEMERIKSMVEEQNAKINQLMDSLQKQESGFEKPGKL